jgi:hypothetical protein
MGDAPPRPRGGARQVCAAPGGARRGPPRPDPAPSGPRTHSLPAETSCQCARQARCVKRGHEHGCTSGLSASSSPRQIQQQRSLSAGSASRPRAAGAARGGAHVVAMRPGARGRGAGAAGVRRAGAGFGGKRGVSGCPGGGAGRQGAIVPRGAGFRRGRARGCEKVEGSFGAFLQGVANVCVVRDADGAALALAGCVRQGGSRPGSSRGRPRHPWRGAGRPAGRPWRREAPWRTATAAIRAARPRRAAATRRRRAAVPAAAPTDRASARTDCRGAASPAGLDLRAWEGERARGAGRPSARLFTPTT